MNEDNGNTAVAGRHECVVMPRPAVKDEDKMYCADPDCEGIPGCQCRTPEYWSDIEKRKNKQQSIDDLLRSCYSVIYCFARGELDKREIALLQKYADDVKAATGSKAA